MDMESDMCESDMARGEIYEQTTSSVLPSEVLPRGRQKVSWSRIE